MVQSEGWASKISSPGDTVTGRTYASQEVGVLGFNVKGGMPPTYLDMLALDMCVKMVPFSPTE